MARKVMLRNFMSLGMSRLLVRSATGLAGIVAARHLGAEGYGTWAAAMAFATVAAVFTNLGTSQVLLRDGARGADDLPFTLGGALGVKGAALLMVYPAMLGLSLLLRHPPVLTTTLAILGGGILLQTTSQIPIALYQASERMHFTALLQLALAVSLLVGVSAVGAAGGGLLQMAAVPAAISLVILPPLLARTVARYRPRWRLSHLPNLLRASIPFALGNLFFLLNAQAALMVLGSRVEPESVGLYAAAAKLVALLYFVPNVVASVVYPALFRTAAADPDRHRAASSAVLRWVSLFGLAMAGGLFLAADAILWLVYGPSYAEAAPLLRILAWILALQCVSYPLGDALTTTDHQRLRVRVTAGVALLNLGVAWVAAGRYGVQGVAFVAVAAEAALGFGYGLAVRSRLPGYRPVAVLLPGLAAAAVAFVAALLVRASIPLPEPWEGLVAAGAFAVFGLALLRPLRFFQAEDRALLGWARRDNASASNA